MGRAGIVQDLRDFLLLWVGGTVSIFGTTLSGFAVGVWVYQQTGSATEFALISVATLLPGLLVSPFAGAIVDRLERRLVMILGDLVAAAMSLVLFALLVAGRLEVWHIYLLVSLTSISNAFQAIAFETVLTQLVPREHFGRAHGMLQFGQAGARILAPLAAGVLIGIIGLQGVVLIDFATFLFGTSMLLLVRFPKLPEGARPPRKPLLKEAAYGWTYIKERPGLVGLVVYFSALNLLVGMGMILVTPLVLSFASAAELGFVLSAGSAGALVGGLVMSAWGGPKKRMSGLLALTPVLGLAFLLVGVRPLVLPVAAGIFLLFATVPIINGTYFAIWQRKVEPAVQGRVFAMRRLIVQFTAPVAYLIAGPLADRVFEPLFGGGGRLSGLASGVVGSGAGRGIGLLFLVMGFLLLVVTTGSLLHPRLRSVEEELPDVTPPAAPARA